MSIKLVRDAIRGLLDGLVWGTPLILRRRCRRAKDVQRVWWSGAIVLFHRNLINGSGVWWTHANQAGGILSKQDVSWRNINGILIRTPRHQLFLHFRRLPPYLRDRG